MNRIRTRILTALLLAAALPTAVHARVLDRAADGFTLENVETVPVDADTAWRGLVEQVGRWWPADHTWFGDAAALSIDARAGGCFCEIDGARQAAHMQIGYADPGRLLRMLGGLGPLQGMGLHGALDWSFEAVEGGTRITLRYRVGGYTPDDVGAFANVVDRVQAQQLGALAAFLRGGAPTRP